jgi:solute carrier family 45 protein 1/2/4
VLARGVGGVKRLWGIVNFVLAICLAMTVLVTKLAQHSRHFVDGTQDPLPPSAGIQAGALVLFSVLGIPLAVNPFFKFLCYNFFMKIVS